jgi:hypothetical protein
MPPRPLHSQAGPPRLVLRSALVQAAGQAGAGPLPARLPGVVLLLSIILTVLVNVLIRLL